MTEEEETVTLEYPLETILSFDIEQLKANIKRHLENIVIFTKAVEDAKEQVKILETYIKIIERYKKK